MFQNQSLCFIHNNNMTLSWINFSNMFYLLFSMFNQTSKVMLVVTVLKLVKGVKIISKEKFFILVSENYT